MPVDLMAIFTLSLALAGAEDERIVCVPSFDGSGWDCGKGVETPAPRALPASKRRAAANTPPPYLIDPSKLPELMGAAPPVDYSAPPPPEPPSATATDPVPTPVTAAEAPVAPAPLPAAQAVAAPEPVVAPEPTAAPEPMAAPEPVPAPEPVAAAEPAATPKPVLTAEPAAVVAPATMPRPVPGPAASPATPPPTRSISSVARDAADLLALPGTGFTVQLAAAQGIAGFAAFRQQLGVAVEDTFVIKVRREGADWWLMLWRDFPDLPSARSAASTLGAHGSFWPRRLAPLQAEIRATPE